jgi:hypothetical protein
MQHKPAHRFFRGARHLAALVIAITATSTITVATILAGGSALAQSPGSASPGSASPGSASPGSGDRPNRAERPLRAERPAKPRGVNSGRGPGAGGELSSSNPNITVQLPTFGVAVDALGVLAVQAAADPDGRLRAERLAAARGRLAPRLQAASKLRKISLVRLEKAIRAQLDAGQPLDEAQQMLAGIQRVEYVFCLPETGDVLLAGPAEGWLADAAGRIVGITSGRPVVPLDDLLVALRAYGPTRRDRPFIGCTIDPSPAALTRLAEFQRQIPRNIPAESQDEAAAAIANGIRQSLGLADVRIFGVPANTRFSQTLVEADYRMKLIGIGLEPPPTPMMTFARAIGGAAGGSPRQATLERWWFTPNYDCVRITDDSLGMALVGAGVQLQGEDKTIGPDGKLLAGSHPPNKASGLFTASFTRKYPEIAARSPVYAQLRNCIDLLVAAAFIRRQGFYERVHWTAATLTDERLLPAGSVETPRRVACAVNAFWNGNRLLTPAGGGVSILAHLALEPGHLLKDEGGKVDALRQNLPAAPADGAWWWD